MRGSAAIFGGADGFEKVPALGIGFLIPAQSETTIVIFAVAIGMPKIDNCAADRLAIVGQDKPDQGYRIAIRIGTKIGFFRGLVAVKRAFGAAAGRFIIGAKDGVMSRFIGWALKIGANIPTEMPEMPAALAASQPCNRLRRVGMA